MKKIFLIPLLTLLSCVMAWAEIVSVNVNSEEGMRAALESAATQDSTEITLTGDINFDAESFVVPENAHVLLNLNGHGITSTYTCLGNCDMREDAIFWIKGLLHIVSEGNSIVSKPVGSGDGGDSGSAIFAPDAGTLIIDGGIYLGGYANAGADMGFPLFVQLPIFWSYSYSEPERKSNIIINGGTFLTTTRSTMVAFGMFQKEGISPNYSISGGVFSKTLDAGYLAANRKTASVPYKNANITGYDATAKTVYAVVPTEGAQQITENTEINSDTEYAFLYVDPGKELTINKGATLHVGTGGIVMGGTDSKITVVPGGQLISEGDIVTSDDANLHLTMDEVTKEYSYVAFKTNGPLAKHPNATVVLKSKAKCDGGVYTYQRFAVPTYRNDIARKQSAENTAFTYDKVAAPTAIYRWDYSADDWTVLAPAGDDTFEPFQGYDLTTTAAAAGSEYTFKCELVGRGNAVLPLQANKKWQYFANSYTAPIDVATLVTDLYNNKSSYLNAGVWVHKINGKGWDAIGWGDVEDGDPISPAQIQPMQAFVYNLTGSAANTELDYDNLVFNPMLSAANSAAGAPRRRVANADYTRATIAIEAADGTNDLVKLYEGSEFDATINNGYDMPKLMNEECVNMYFNAAEGNLARFASDNVANTAITIETKEATSYTMNFKNVSLEGYALRDNLTDTETPLVSGYTYNFSAPANSKIEGRFEIVAAKLPTAIEDVEVNANVKGIYSLTGQYLGENFHALPAGVYVINGKKVVK